MAEQHPCDSGTEHCPQRRRQRFHDKRNKHFHVHAAIYPTAHTPTCTVTGGNGKTASASFYAIINSRKIYDIIIMDAVADNKSSTYVSSSSGINFSSPASNTNGRGIYQRGTTGIYYYRGSVSDNNVIFAGYCWKMVITTSSKGVKLIYNGVPSGGSCTGSSPQIGSSAFNSKETDNAYIGYMYGTPETSTVYGDLNGDGSVSQTDYLLLYRFVSGAQTPTAEQRKLGDVNMDGTLNASDLDIVNNYILGNIRNNDILYSASNEARYNATHKNTNSSTIKNVIDTWYRSNMTSYTSDLEDAVWCNDRSKRWSAFGFANYGTAYSASSRSTPSLTCTNANDRFTVSTSKGNGALTYPVGLLTYDEYILAGSTSGYLNSGSTWWTMTPNYFSATVTAYEARNYVGTTATAVDNSRAVRPAIVLKYGAEITGTYSSTAGYGTSSKPYVIN